VNTVSGSGPSRRFVSRRLWLALAALMLLAPVAVALASRGGGASSLKFAGGVRDGSFHPIAGKFVPDGTKLEDCDAKPRCLEQGFGNVAYTDGPKAALALFNRRKEVDKAVAGDCHRIAHMIGSAALGYFKGNVAQTYAHGGATCSSGYYHGILERAFAQVRSERGLIRAARTLCRGAGVRRRGFLDYQCAHGLGHGLMIQTGYDLPTALSVCRQLQTRWDEISCAGGVFMENGSTVYGLRSPWLKDDDPIYPCRRIKLRNRASCYLRVTTQILRTNKFDWQRTVETCRGLERRWQRYCFRSYGRDAVNYTGGKAESILRLCRLTTTAEGVCLYGAARSFADRDVSVRRAVAFCHRAPIREQGSCFAGVGVVVGLFQATDAERVRVCRALTETYVTACAGAAKAEVAPEGRGAWG
jgi:hypothetical protein